MTHAEATARAAHLASELHRHNRLYSTQARPEISDQQFDALLLELQDIQAKFPHLQTAESPKLPLG